MDREQILFHRDKDAETPLKQSEMDMYIMAAKENNGEKSTTKWQTGSIE